MRLERCIGAIRAIGFAAAALSVIPSPVLAAEAGHIGVMTERPDDETGGEKIPVTGFRVLNGSMAANAIADALAAQAVANQLLAAYATQGAAGLKLPLEQLPAVGSSAAGSAMSIGQIQIVADRLTEYYRRAGYFVAKVYVPVQDIGTDGVVSLQAQEGVVGAVRVKADPNLSFPLDLVTQSAQSLIGKPVTEKTAQGAVLYAKSLPGISASATFEPGSRPGETDLVYIVKPGKAYSGALVADNFGTDASGKFRLRADAALVNPFGMADLLSASILAAFQPENTVLGSIDYRLPTGMPGASLFMGYSSTQFKVNQAQFSVLALEGDSNAYTIGGDWNFLRSRAADASFALFYSRKDSKVDVKAGGSSFSVIDDNINLLTAQLSANNTDFARKGINYYTLSVRGGNVESGSQNPSSVSPRFGVFSGRYVRYQLLPGHQEAVLQLSGQFSNQTLSSLEQFTMGGPENVRAYSVSEQLRDSGVFGSAEWRIYAPGFYDAPGPFGHSWGELLQLSAFYDYAVGKYSQNLPSNAPTGAVLSGVGVGMNFNVPGRFRFRLTAATPLNRDYVSPNPNDTGDFRFFGEVTYNF